ncbi:MAG: NAD(P)H-hydrate dehydratase [Ardenticatenia bacterium]|nr:NAD(P)H-hydrate dehydratase [Ardenticatenia bacterium]
MTLFVYTVEQMRALEAAADRAGHTYDTMMERAGLAVADVITTRHNTDETRVVVLVGPGHNGGDGLVASRVLANRGYQVVAFLWRRPVDEPRSQAARQAGVSLIPLDGSEDGWRTLERALRRASVIVDALLGTGVSRPIGEPLSTLLERLRAAREQPPRRTSLVWAQTEPQHSLRPRGPTLVAVDLPTGLNAATGAVDPATVPADITVTFAGPKAGMLLPPGSDVIGELVVADIGIPTQVVSAAEHVGEFMSPDVAAALVPPRPRSGHKGTFGRVLVVGGSANFVGAPALAAEGAARSGAGLVTLAVPTVLASALTARPDLTSITWLMLPHDLGALRPEALNVLAEELPKYDALVVGMGLGQEPVTQAFVYKLLGLRAPEAPRPSIGFVRSPQQEPEEPVPNLPPTVLDADALNALAAFDGAWEEQLPAGRFVLTPHPGEMARLMGVNVSDVQARRLALARQQAKAWRQVVVLKGAFTVVAAPDGRVSVSPFAHPILATAGTGDVLAGLIGGLLAQGIPPFDAAAWAPISTGWPARF